MTSWPADIESRAANGASVTTSGWRDTVNLVIFWLRDESLEDSANLPEPDVLAAEIAEDLRAALEQFESIAQELGREDAGEPG
jgi:hypothetical protein